MLLAGLIVMNISRVHQHFPVVAMLRPALVFTALAVLMAFLSPLLLGPRSILRSYQARIIAGLTFMACLSAVLGISFGHSASFILDSFWKLVALTLLLMLSIRSEGDLYTFVWANVIGAAVLALLALFVFQLSDTSGLARLSEGYTYDANDIGCVVVLAIPLTLLAFHSSGVAGRIVSGVTLLALGMTLARTGSRGAFVGLVATAAALLVLLNVVSVAKRTAFVAVLLVGIGLAAPAGYWRQMLTVTSPTEDYNWTSPIGRRAVAMRGLGYMMSRPIAGLGIDNFGFAEGTISDRARAHERGDEGIKWSAAHNSFIQAGAELGIPGLVLFTLLIAGSTRRLIKLRRQIPPSWMRTRGSPAFLYGLCTVLPVSLIGFAVAGSFVSFAYMDAFYILVALTAGTEMVVRKRLAAAHAGELPAAVRVQPLGRGGLLVPARETLSVGRPT